jgi:thioredoxin-like negative regulator of GroEL
MDPEKNVFVTFTASWCGHCNRLEPLVAQVAESFSEADNVIIANIDVPTHQSCVTEYQIQAFPTIYYFPAHKADGVDLPAVNPITTTVETNDDGTPKAPLPTKGPNMPLSYGGGRSAEAIVDFINQKSQGSWRTVGGEVQEKAGVSDETTAAVEALLHTVRKEPKKVEEAKQKLISAVQATILAGDVRRYYSRYITALLDSSKGEAYLEKERQRLETLLATEEMKHAGLSATRSVKVRKNILSLFKPPAPIA